MGVQGKDGKNMTEEEIQAVMEEEMERKIAEMPQSVIMKYHMKFKARDGKDYTVKAEITHKTGAKVTDEEREPVLYLPQNPNKAVILDAISHVPEIWPDGSFAPLPFTKIRFLILPILAIMVNIFCLLMHFAETSS